MGLFARHHVPGQQIALGVVDPDRLRPAYDAAVARDDADIDMGVRDLRAPPRDDYVRQRGDGGAKADRSTLDGGDHRNGQIDDPIDRKSTRLNSRSLMRISYAVFCLKKKNNITKTQNRM